MNIIIMPWDLSFYETVRVSILLIESLNVDKGIMGREFREQISGFKQVKICFGRMLNINEMKVRNTNSSIHLNVFCSGVMLWFLVTVHQNGFLNLSAMLWFFDFLLLGRGHCFYLWKKICYLPWSVLNYRS